MGHLRCDEEEDHHVHTLMAYSQQKPMEEEEEGIHYVHTASKGL